MKRILIVCLLGMGLLLPSTIITAKEFIIKPVVDVTIEGYWLRATSDVNTGTIKKVKVIDNTEHVVIEQSCNGYTCDVDAGGLPSGLYKVEVHTTMTVYSENIYLN